EFDLAIERENQPEYRKARASLRLIRGDFFGAEDDLDGIIPPETADANALHLRGISRYGQGKAAEALADYNAALVLSTHEPALLGSRMLTYLHLGNLDEAAKDCAQLESIEEVDPEGCSGVLQLARGNFEGALGHLTTASLHGGGWYSWQGL